MPVMIGYGTFAALEAPADPDESPSRSLPINHHDSTKYGGLMLGAQLTHVVRFSQITHPLPSAQAAPPRARVRSP